jgi:hypothetical protein
MTRDDRFLDDCHEMYVKNMLVLQIEKSEQRSVIKVLVLKGLDAKAIQRQLIIVLTSTAYSVSQVKKLIVRFKQSEKTCEDQS